MKRLNIAMTYKSPCSDHSWFSQLQTRMSSGQIPIYDSPRLKAQMWPQMEQAQAIVELTEEFIEEKLDEDS